MKSLDQLLSEKAQNLYQTNLNEALNVTTWTAENRDSKLQEIRTIAESVCTITEEFIHELLDTEIDGRSLLWHKVREQFIVGEIELLMGFRDELDASDEPSEIVTYDWLNAAIKSRYKEMTQSSEIFKKLESGDVEQI